jgi:hypothetical protein
MRAAEAEDWTGRLWDLPLIWLRPLRVPVERLRHSAPDWLRERAEARSSPLRRGVLDALRGVGTAVVPQVPVWLPQRGVGYVLDFLFPEYGVNLQLDSWAEAENGDKDPDHAWNLVRDEDLRAAHGIETLHYWDVAVAEMLDHFPEEIRRELGIGRPRWLRKFG